MGRSFQGITLGMVLLITVVMLLENVKSWKEGARTAAAYKQSTPLAARAPLRYLETAPQRNTSHRAEVYPYLSKESPLQDTQAFQSVTGTKTVVFSAFLDGQIVRVIGFRQRKDPKFFHCQLWFDLTTKYEFFSTKGTVATIPENHNKLYTATYIQCKLPTNMTGHHRPLAVSLVTDQARAVPSNRVQVQLPAPSKQWTFTVCVPPIQGNFSDVHGLVEMVEFNRILGADMVVFYNHSIHPDMGRVLRHYQERGHVDVIQWPEDVPTPVHYFGQMAAINDCLYRYRSRSHYLVFQDLDEFIVPTASATYTWGQLLKSRQKPGKQFAAFQVRNSFVRLDYPRLSKNFSRNEDVKKYRSKILANTIREKKLYPINSRTKFIAIPEFVETVGIHYLWKASRKMDRIPENEAILYHYRKTNLFPTNVTIEDDRIVNKYGQKLMSRLANAWEEISKNI